MHIFRARWEKQQFDPARTSHKKIIPSKLEVAPNALKMWDWTGVDGWMDGYPLDCYDY